MKSINKTTRFLIFIIISLFMFSACESSVTDSEPEEISNIRVIHSSASAGNLDFYYRRVGESTDWRLVSGVDFGEQYGFYSFYTSSIIYSAYYTNTSIVAAKDTLNLENGKFYTIVANDLDASINPSLLAFEDTNEKPSAGRTLLRFINLTSDMPSVDISNASGNIILSGLDAHRASSYLEMSAGTYQFKVTRSDSRIEILGINSSTFNDGLVYTVILSGSAEPSDNFPLNAKIYQDINVE